MTENIVVAPPPVPVTTVAAVIAPAVAATHVELKAQFGAWIADFTDKAEPIAAMLLMAIWTHFAPALLRAFVPTSVVEGAINSVFASMSGFVQNQSVSFSVPSGWVADVLGKIITNAPDLLTYLETELDPVILAQMKALGVIPAST